jgi:hypothetical protein
VNQENGTDEFISFARLIDSNPYGELLPAVLHASARPARSGNQVG